MESAELSLLFVVFALSFPTITKDRCGVPEQPSSIYPSAVGEGRL